MAVAAACGTPPTLAAARLTTPVMVGPVKYLGETQPQRGDLPTGPVNVEVYQSAISWAMPSGSDDSSNSMTVAHVGKASKVDTEIIRATKMDDGYDVYVDRIHVKARYWMALVVSKVMQGGELEGRTVSIAGGASAQEEPEAPPAPPAPPLAEEASGEDAGDAAADEGSQDAQ